LASSRKIKIIGKNPAIQLSITMISTNGDNFDRRSTEALQVWRAQQMSRLSILPWVNLHDSHSFRQITSTDFLTNCC